MLMSFIGVVSFCHSGFVINDSRSIAVGIYKSSDEPIETGRYVSFCPPINQVVINAFHWHFFNAGACPGGFAHLLKKIVASAGDLVEINQSGMFINGRKLRHSTPIVKDSNGHLIETHFLHGYVMKEGEFLMYGDGVSNSFDSRYFGVVKREQITSVINQFYLF